jgi:hypothetical protein
VELNQTVGKLWKHAVENKTRESYDVGYTHFERFMLLNKVHLHARYIHVPPILEEIPIYFVACCFRHLNLQYSTIKLYLCGIHYKYLQSPFEKPDQRNLKKLDQSNLEKPDQSNLKKLALMLKYVRSIRDAMYFCKTRKRQIE